MRVLFAGTPGVCKTQVLDRLKAYVEKNDELGPRQRIFAPIFEHALYEDNAKAFLELSNRDQAQRWEDNFRQFRKDETAARADHTFLGVHLAYRYKRFPSCAISFPGLLNWKPDCIVTLIDDAFCVRHRIHKGGYRNFTLDELVLWRGEELLLGDVLARLVKRTKPIPNFLLAVKHPTAMLARLLASVRGTAVADREKAGRVYLSYHITATRGTTGGRATIDKFRMKTRQNKHAQNLAVFDPLAIDELPLVSLAKKARGKTVAYKVRDPQHRWPLLQPKQLLVSDDGIPDTIRIPIGEVEAAADGMRTQVNRRDYRLIEQCHAVCVYRPTLAGPSPSSGVLSELQYSRNIGRDVIVYIKEGDPMPRSPFFDEAGPGYFVGKTETKLLKWFATAHTKFRDLDAFLRR